MVMFGYHCRWVFARQTQGIPISFDRLPNDFCVRLYNENVPQLSCGCDLKQVCHNGGCFTCSDYCVTTPQSRGDIRVAAGGIQLIANDLPVALRVTHYLADRLLESCHVGIQRCEALSPSSGWWLKTKILSVMPRCIGVVSIDQA